MSHVANRRSPSGPKTSIQLPYFNTQPPIIVATNFLAIPNGPPVAGPAAVYAQFEIPAQGKLDTLQIRNNPVGLDGALTTYQVRKNAANVGSPLIIANNAVGPVKIDLSTILVNPGDLIDIQIDTVVSAGAPIARVFFSWTPSTAA